MFDSGCKKSEMYQIPYIEHEKRIFKAYKKEKRLIALLIGSNFFWLIMCILILIAR